MKAVTVCFPYTLPCVKDSAVVICVDAALTVSGNPFIDGNLLGVDTLNTHCGSLEYCHHLTYEECQLLAPDVDLCPEDVNGAFCDNCLREWIEDQVSAAKGPWWPGASMYGDGSDGDLTVAAEEWLPTTLTSPVRNYYFHDVTIEANGKLHPWGVYDVQPPPNDTLMNNAVRIFISGTLTVRGAITADGIDALNMVNSPDGSTPDAGPGGGYLETPNSAVSANQNADYSGYDGVHFFGGLGGAGGNGGGVGAGLGYTPVEPDDGIHMKSGYLVFKFKSALYCEETDLAGGGCGGGGGGGKSAGNSTGGDGGEGGWGGGMIYIAARRIVVESGGIISARGGDGLAGGAAVNNGNGAATGGGGGGGGGGGLVYLVYDSISNAGLITAAGGAGGAGGAGVNGGASGQAGLAGVDGYAYRMYLPTGEFE